MQDATTVAEEKIAKIHQGLAFIRELQENVTRGDHLITQQAVMKYKLPDKKLMFEPIPEKIDSASFNGIIGSLYLDALSAGFRPGFAFGRLHTVKNKGSNVRRYAFISVSGSEKKLPGILELPAIEYMAIHTPTSQIEDAAAVFSELFDRDTDKILIESEAISSVYSTADTKYELYCAEYEI